ncbi:hypothetical protein G3I15_11560, partial [Streptomyces sp. SID10244]|nr:hypothetical protein [Streptomyces sp. SID10244]
RIAVRDIFDHSTIEELARLAAPAGTDTDYADHRPLATLRHDADLVIAPGPAQQQLWFLNQLAQDPTGTDAESGTAGQYNIAFALDLRGDLDVAALDGALRHAIDRHEPLRTIFPAHDGHPVIDILPADAVSVDLTPTEIRGDDWVTASEQLARKAFDLTAQAPIRVMLHRITDPDGREA